MASRNNDDDTELYVPAADEDLLYDQTIRRLRLEVDKGKTYAQACRAVPNMDQELLKKEIGEDFLKIIVAERHFGEGYGIDDIALLLDISYEKIETIRDYVLSDIGTTLNRGKNVKMSDMTH